MSKVLFLIKNKKNAHKDFKSGLYYSASFLKDMLNKNGVQAHLVCIDDLESIIKTLTLTKPTHVIIEALWVPPIKFTELCELFPNIIWIVRLHSETPFLASEMVAMDWILEYLSYPNIIIATNGNKILKEIRFYAKLKLEFKNDFYYDFINEKIIYLPNYYPQEYYSKLSQEKKDTIDIGCFGAVRPMKNHLIQAIAAIKFSNKIGKKLRFHINGDNTEMKGGPVLNNLTGLFSHLYKTDHKLVNDKWLSREEFLESCENIDIGMQVSFSETFNIVAADLISQSVPVVGSKEIPWMCRFFCGKPTSVNNIYYKLLLTYYFSKINVWSNRFFLDIYINKSRKIWLNYFKN